MTLVKLGAYLIINISGGGARTNRIPSLLLPSLHLLPALLILALVALPAMSTLHTFPNDYAGFTLSEGAERGAKARKTSSTTAPSGDRGVPRVDAASLSPEEFYERCAGPLTRPLSPPTPIAACFSPTEDTVPPGAKHTRCPRGSKRRTEEPPPPPRRALHGCTRPSPDRALQVCGLA